MNRKYRHFFLIVSAIAALAGCGSSSGSGTSAGSGTKYWAVGYGAQNGPFSTITACQEWLAGHTYGSWLNARCQDHPQYATGIEQEEAVKAVAQEPDPLTPSGIATDIEKTGLSQGEKEK